MNSWVVRAVLVAKLNALYEDAFLKTIRAKLEPDLPADAVFWSYVRFFVYAFGIFVYVLISRGVAPTSQKMVSFLLLLLLLLLGTFVRADDELDDFNWVQWVVRDDSEGVAKFSCYNHAVYEAAQLLRKALPADYKGERVRLENNVEVMHLTQCANEFNSAVVCSCDDNSVELHVYDRRTLLVMEDGHTTIEVDISENDHLDKIIDSWFPMLLNEEIHLSDSWYAHYCRDIDVYSRAVFYVAVCYQDRSALCTFEVRMNAVCALHSDILRVEKKDVVVAVFVIDGKLKTLVERDGETKHHSYVLTA